MKTFFQGKGESVVINGEIRVRVLKIDHEGGEVMLAIDAPQWVQIYESEAGRSEDVLEEWSLLQPR